MQQYQLGNQEADKHRYPSEPLLEVYTGSGYIVGFIPMMYPEQGE